MEIETKQTDGTETSRRPLIFHKDADGVVTGAGRHGAGERRPVDTEYGALVLLMQLRHLPPAAATVRELLPKNETPAATREGSPAAMLCANGIVRVALQWRSRRQKHASKRV